MDQNWLTCPTLTCFKNQKHVEEKFRKTKPENCKDTLLDDQPAESKVISALCTTLQCSIVHMFHLHLHNKISSNLP